MPTMTAVPASAAARGRQPHYSGAGGNGGEAGAGRTASGAIDVSRGHSNNTGDGYLVVTLSINS